MKIDKWIGYEIVIAIMTASWVGLTYASIWIADYRLEFFFTGLFTLILAILFNEGYKKDKEKEDQD